jgi:glycosyltransferase involved in cell wall biosynthesis
MHFVGNGPLFNEIITKIEELGLKERVIFYGWVDVEVADTLMASADILLLPSLAEGMPIVVLNAMALGLSILGSSIPPLQELITEGRNGYLCPADDREQLSSRLKMLLENRSLRKKIHDYNKQDARKYDWNIIVNEYEQVLQSVISI